MGERQLIGFSASVTVLCGSLEKVLFLVMKTSFIGFTFKVKSLHFWNLKLNSKWVSLKGLGHMVVPWKEANSNLYYQIWIKKALWIKRNTWKQRLELFYKLMSHCPQPSTFRIKDKCSLASSYLIFYCWLWDLASLQPESMSAWLELPGFEA